MMIKYILILLLLFSWDFNAYAQDKTTEEAIAINDLDFSKKSGLKPQELEVHSQQEFDEEKMYFSAVEWFDALKKEEQKEIQLRQERILDKMISLHAMTKKFDDNDHLDLIKGEALMSSENKDVNFKSSRKVKKALNLLQEIKKDRDMLSTQEDTLLYNEFISEISKVPD